MNKDHAIEAPAAESDARKAPPGYTEEHVALTKRLTTDLVATMREHPGHVVLSVLLTTYMQIASEYGGGAQIRAAEYLVMTGTGFLNQASKVMPGQEIDHDVGAIAAAIEGFIASRRHGPTLDALLRVFKALAEKFPCCTAQAAGGALKVAQELATTAAAVNGPGSTSVH